MKSLVQEKQKAIELRKKGCTYNEILEVLPVAKSSLSLWLKGLPLTAVEKRHLRKRTNNNISKGRIRAASARRKNSELEHNKQFQLAKEEYYKYASEGLFQAGVALYWAEGAKRSDMFLFSNSDEKMLLTMLLWLERFTEYKRTDLGFRLYIHEPFMHLRLERWWAAQLYVSEAQFKKTVIKPSGIGVKKRPNYRGCLRLEVPKSKRLLMKMKHWISNSIEYHLDQ